MSGQQHAPTTHYLRKRPGTHFTGGWVGPRTGLAGRKKSRPHRDSIPDLPARSQLLYRPSYRAHKLNGELGKKVTREGRYKISRKFFLQLSSCHMWTDSSEEANVPFHRAKCPKTKFILRSPVLATIHYVRLLHTAGKLEQQNWGVHV